VSERPGGARLLASLALALAATSSCATPGLVTQVASGECRAGVPHGRYELRGVDGVLSVEGAFADGEKQGVFHFYTTRGTEIAEIPYERNQKHGTVRLWYGELAYPDAAGRPKLQGAYANDRLDGTKESWWPSGAKRTREEFEAGALGRAQAWAENGAALTEAQASDRSARDAEADVKFYRILEGEIDRHPTPCTEPAA
jgi:antitoxin component YwqK of YwqJK toxin-antitoxin module